jgi:hypothetical protein
MSLPGLFERSLERMARRTPFFPLFRSIEPNKFFQNLPAYA